MVEAGCRIRIRREYDVQYPDPIQVRCGEIISVGHEDDAFHGWKWCKASDGREGWVPADLPSNEGSSATVLSDYSAKELAVRPGEEVVVEDARAEWLLVRNELGDRGWIPSLVI